VARPLKRTLKILLSLAFVATIAWSMRDQDLGAVARRLHPGYALLSLAVSLAMIGVSCWKWKALLELEAAPLPFRRLLRHYFVGYYYTVLLPSNVGGDVARALLAGRDIGSHSRAAVSVFLERVTGLALLLVLACTTPLLVPGLVRRPIVFVPVLASAVLLVGLGLAFFLPDPRRWGRLAGDGPGWLACGFRRGAEVLGTLHDRLHAALRELHDRPGRKAAVALLTLVFYALTWVNIRVTFLAFGENVPWSAVIAVAPVCMIIACLPLAPFAGLGLTEGAYLAYFGLLGVAAPATLAMALFLRLKLILFGICGMLCQWSGTLQPEPGDERRDSL
jgi:uncharacterized protein (TIRG00374 family)